jgi:hypothetical protein
MKQTLTQNWWLLALAGALEAAYAVLMLLMQDENGSLTLRTSLSKATVVLLGKLGIAAGVCTMAAGLWKSTNGKAWWLAVNGVAVCALGALELIVAEWAVRMSFRPLAMLFVVMAVGIGMFVLGESRLLVFRFAGAISMSFALLFLVLTIGAINLRQHPPEFLNIWMGAYFAFSAICLLGLAWHVHGSRPTRLTPSVIESYPSPNSPHLA